MSDPAVLSNATNDPEGMSVTTMSWSGLIECTLDGVAAMRTHREYTASPAYKSKVDSLSTCLNEISDRLERLKCLPAPGEPSFTLLARDPQAPALVRDWVEGRCAEADPSPATVRKIAEAQDIAESMSTWQQSHGGSSRTIQAVSVDAHHPASQ